MTIEQIKEELQKRSNEDALSSNVLAYINDLEKKINKLKEKVYKQYEEDKDIWSGDYNYQFILDFDEDLLEILEED